MILNKAHISPVTKIAPSSSFWGIDQSVHYGNLTHSTHILSTNAGIIDTGKVPANRSQFYAHYNLYRYYIHPSSD
jgi:hypothetical protein